MAGVWNSIARYIFLRRRGRLQIRRRGLSELTMRRLGIWIEKDEKEVEMIRPRFYEVGLGGGGGGGGGGEKGLRLDGTSTWRKDGLGNGGGEESLVSFLSFLPVVIFPSRLFDFDSLGSLEYLLNIFDSLSILSASIHRDPPPSSAQTLVFFFPPTTPSPLSPHPTTNQLPIPLLTSFAHNSCQIATLTSRQPYPPSSSPLRLNLLPRT